MIQDLQVGSSSISGLPHQVREEPLNNSLCSAARALARRLANEQAIAIASAKSLAGDSLDEEELEL